MKYRYFSIFIFLFSFRTFSQPVLNQSNSFSDGTSIHLFLDPAPTLNQGNGGVNQVWDFSSLTSFNPVTNYYGMPATLTPYSNDFPDAQIATLNLGTLGDSIFNYFTNDAVHYTSWGYAFDQAIIAYTDPRDILHYPFTYGDSFTDSYFYGSPFSSDYGQVEVTADGYGTLLLPSGTFDNCLRVREVRNDTAEGEISFNTSMDTSYKFYSATFPEPLCNVIHHHSTNLASYSEIYWQDVQAEGVVNVGDDHVLLSYPNPCNDWLDVQIPPGNNFLELQITNGIGENFEIPFQNKNNSIRLNTASLPDGIYFLSVKTPAQTFVVPFVKNRT